MPFTSHLHRRFPLIYFSGFISLSTLLLPFNGPAYAEWMAIGSTDDGLTAYADPDSIRRKEAMVKIWILFDFKTTQTVASHLILSIKGEEEYDCDGNRRRVLTSSEFSGNMGSGKEVTSNSGEGNWFPVAPGGVVQALWTFACAKQ